MYSTSSFYDQFYLTINDSKEFVESVLSLTLFKY